MKKKVTKNFSVTFDESEKKMIDEFFDSRPHMVRAAVIRKTLIDWVKEQLKKEGE